MYVSNAITTGTCRYTRVRISTEVITYDIIIYFIQPSRRKYLLQMAY